MISWMKSCYFYGFHMPRVYQNLLQLWLILNKESVIFYHRHWLMLNILYLQIMSDGSVPFHPICIIHHLRVTHQSVVSYWAFEIVTKIMYYVLLYYVNKKSTSYSITNSYRLLHFKDSSYFEDYSITLDQMKQDTRYCYDVSGKFIIVDINYYKTETNWH